MKRIFIAVRIITGTEFLRIHSSFRSILINESIKWTDPSNIHLTLAFLGDTDDEMISRLSVMLKQKCEGFGNFSFSLKGTGIFRNLRDPKVLWIGVEQNEELKILHDRISPGLKDMGFRLDDRPFSPHITVGRIRFLRNTDLVRTAMEKYRDTLVQVVPVNEVILYESILKPSGPVYLPLGIFPLSS